jgi:hypothetical protein
MGLKNTSTYLTDALMYWSRKRKVQQPKEMLTKMLVWIQKELAMQQLMKSLLGGISKVDPDHPVWTDMLEVPYITKNKLNTLRKKFLPKGMESAMTQEAKDESQESRGCLGGEWVRSRPQRLWPTQDDSNGWIKVYHSHSKLLENFKPTSYLPRWVSRGCKVYVPVRAGRPLGTEGT